MATSEDATLPAGLAGAISVTDGRDVLLADVAVLSEETVAAIRQAADTAARGEDRAEAEDLSDWAAYARVLVAWRTLLQRAPASYEEFTTMVAAAQPDDRFFDVGIDMVRFILAGYDQALGATPPEQAAADAALANASTRSRMLVLIADVTGDSDRGRHR